MKTRIQEMRKVMILGVKERCRAREMIIMTKVIRLKRKKRPEYQVEALVQAPLDKALY